MAQLLRVRARSPVIEKGYAIGSVGWSEDGKAYRIDVYASDPKSPNYYVLLTRAEMLQATISWLESDSRDEREAAKAARTAVSERTEA
jgi:hypothetical protein